MIEVKSLSYSYYSEGKNRSLENISLDIKNGECVLLCGKSGSGKTTFTRLLNGIIPNFHDGDITGEVLLDGENLLELPMYAISKKVGTVFQNPRTQFYTVNTTSEIAFGCENLGIPAEEIERRVKKTAADLEIEHLLNRNIFKLSGGEKQIIAFASVYAMAPQIYVLDEPSSNLDAETINKLQKILGLLKRQGKTIIIAEHRTSYLKDLVERAIYFEDGKILCEYSMNELSSMPMEARLKTGIRTVDLMNYPVKENSYAPAESALEINGLRFFYGKSEALHIDQLKIPSGRITAVIGNNGAGKSTFVSCLCGLLKKTRGDISIDGKKVSSKDRLKQSYIVMQEVNHQLFSDSVRSEITLGVKDFSEEDLTRITDTLAITPLLERHPMTLSGGQKQRTIIASALVCGKGILCFDEPTSGLDFSSMIKACTLFKGLQNKNRFIFIITHDYELIASVCDSVIHIEKGGLKDYYSFDKTGIEEIKRILIN